MRSALERAVSAENWLGNVPIFITSNSCEKGERSGSAPCQQHLPSAARAGHSPLAPQPGKRVSFSRGLSQH